MRRIWRMGVVLSGAALLSAHLPFNLVLVAVIALAFQDMCWSDVIILGAAAVLRDVLGTEPLGVSLLPMAAAYLFVHLLRSQIYVQNLVSRLAWAVMAAGIAHLIWALVLMLRGYASAYGMASVLMGVPALVGEGVLAALFSPVLQWVLVVTWADLRRPKTIVVP
jgi:hypothetical protein